MFCVGNRDLGTGPVQLTLSELMHKCKPGTTLVGNAVRLFPLLETLLPEGAASIHQIQNARLDFRKGILRRFNRRLERETGT